jgi:REP element-mobilizing transposase RayT
MGYPRQTQVCLNDTPYYHVMARCVRRAWLWGFDEYAGKDYSHRKAWVLERLELLSNTFAIDICAYAIMSNHYHVVLHVDRARILACSPQEIVERWSRLFRIPAIVDRWKNGEACEAEATGAIDMIERWRRRLIDVSWFMRCLNEYLARRANAEDQCTGRFWQGRFQSQALLDEAGLLTAMTYVDLNPIRAGIAATPEESEFTSIYERIQAYKAASTTTTAASEHVQTRRLFPFRDQAAPPRPAIPLTLRDYLQLVDWTGRSVRSGSIGEIDSDAPSILDRLMIDSLVWQDAMRVRGNVFGRALGRLDRMRLHAQALAQSRIKGMTRAQELFRMT